MSKKHSTDQVQLSELYQQRKQSHGASAEFKSALLHQRSKRQFKTWRYALPALTASVVTVLLILPKQTIEMADSPVTMDLAFEQTASLDSSEVRAAPMPKPSTAPNEKAIAAAPQANREILSEEEAPQAQTQVIAATTDMVLETEQQPLMAEEVAGLSVASDADIGVHDLAEAKSVFSKQQLTAVDVDEEQISLAEPAAQSVVGIIRPDEKVDDYLWVVDGLLGEFKNCLGETVTLPITTDLSGWVQVELNEQLDEQQRWSLSAEPDYQCEQAEP